MDFAERLDNISNKEIQDPDEEDFAFEANDFEDDNDDFRFVFDDDDIDMDDVDFGDFNLDDEEY